MFPDLQKFTQGNPDAVRKLNALIDRVNELSRLTGDGYVTVKRTVGGGTVGLNIEMLAQRLGRGGTDFKIFEAQSAATGYGVYNCYEQTLDATEWDDTAGDDKFDDKNSTDIEVLNLLENYPHNYASGYSRALAKYDLLQCWQMADDEGASRWIGIPLVPGPRWAITTQAAPASTTITANLYSRLGAEISSGLGSGIGVWVSVSGGGNLNAAIPRLTNNQDIFVFNDAGFWSLANVGQASEDCACN